jgi:hypothetical protein
MPALRAASFIRGLRVNLLSTSHNIYFWFLLSNSVTCIDDLRGASFPRVAVSCALDRIAARGHASLQLNNLGGLILCRFE